MWWGRGGEGDTRRQRAINRRNAPVELAMSVDRTNTRPYCPGQKHPEFTFTSPHAHIKLRKKINLIMMDPKADRTLK